MKDAPPLGTAQSAAFWCDFNVTLHHEFKDAADSLDFFHWRCDQYQGYLDLMPVAGQDGRAVLDFGCGPGHDLIGIGHYSKPSRLVGADISAASLAEAGRRLQLHDIPAQLVLLDPAAPVLPFEVGEFDHVHCSGVLHHTPNPAALLTELGRILKPGGTMNVMVYNRDSVWFHLYAAWQVNLEDGAPPTDDLNEAFRRSTDREDCPISVCWRPEEFIALAESAGLQAELSGVAVSLLEARMFHHRRFVAAADRRWPAECRRFILDCVIDDKGYPMWNGRPAGIDACYRLVKP